LARGLAFAAALALVLALSAPAYAASCFEQSVKQKLDGADAAFVGRVVTVKPVPRDTGVALYDYRFRVLRGVKGRLGERVTVRAAKLVDIDSHAVTPAARADIGVLASSVNGRLVASSCSLVDPGSLLGAADEPKGALIKVAVGVVILGIVLAYSRRRLNRRRTAGSTRSGLM